MACSPTFTAISTMSLTWLRFDATSPLTWMFIPARGNVSSVTPSAVAHAGGVAGNGLPLAMKSATPGFETATRRRHAASIGNSVM